MELQQVVITGLGVLSSNGLGREAFWEGLRQGRSGIRHVQRFDASEFPCQIAGELWDFNPEDFMRKNVVKHWHRHVHQAVACARMSVTDSELDKAGYDPERMAVAVGTSIGSPNEAYQGQVEAYESGGFRKVSKFASSAFSGHAATVHVSIDFGLRGPAITISSGCATGLDVLAWGYNQIRLNQADAALVGATESPIFPMSFATACSLGILSRRNEEPEKAMRPFDKHRDGIVLSEGAAAFVLERKDMALARGAPILAELAGNGSAAEAGNPLILDRQGEALARAISMALKNAGVSPQDVDHIQAHGVSLEMYDRGETNAYKRAFGEAAYRIPISAVKSMVGQSYSAGGLLGVAAALMALNQGVVAPTLNLEDPDPLCDLDFVPRQSRLNDVSTALVTAMSFGGTHSATVLRRVA
ncbi:MAG: beta-ketoacyl-[acyl-carrier-protein] synthase family protein [Candidatus Hydrogenedentes bacterium]|nr:beta-ketoacyl-[acyl-carrier-protein] synthase family protein [Candidatus Hydrogenedentota bacterium]MBI3117135.1 beta-ketoacyl-[acyl-carrier-protein] synthase family protein [Candidatus Hydrogenedentota bacterium]